MDWENVKKMGIDNMPAGSEMDRLIAEHIMGWTVLREPPKSIEHTALLWPLCGVEENYHTKSNEGPWCYPPGFPLQGNGVCVPLYSTDIGAAFEIVKKIINTPCDIGYLYEIEITKGENLPWSAHIHHPLCSRRNNALGKNYESHEAYGDTAPLAICRAALWQTVLGSDHFAKRKED